jgi:hypothetical protein
MTVDETSRRRGAASEITFIAPVKRGNVTDSKYNISYSDRLKRVLSVFNDREDGFDGVAPIPLGLRAFEGIHFAHLVLIDGDTRFLFAVNFDGSASNYLAGLSTDVPWLLHLVFSHCVGWNPVNDKPDVLIRFIERHQVETNFWYAHDPVVSVRDIAWGNALRRELESAPIGSTPSDNAQRLQAVATQFSAPRPYQRKLAQLFAARPSAELALAKKQFQGVFEPLFSAPEWKGAYRETFGVDVQGGS